MLSWKLGTCLNKATLKFQKVRYIYQIDIRSFHPYKHILMQQDAVTMKLTLFLTLGSTIVWGLTEEI